MRKFRVLSILSIFALLLTACGQETPTQAPAAQPTAASQGQAASGERRSA